eukprot:scaffold1824_cov332-Prasinococcus_capsulatus_cf.AAC.1
MQSLASYSSSTARTWSLARLYLPKSDPTNTRLGHSFSAMKPGIAERTPYLRACARSRQQRVRTGRERARPGPHPRQRALSRTDLVVGRADHADAAHGHGHRLVLRMVQRLHRREEGVLKRLRGGGGGVARRASRRRAHHVDVQPGVGQAAPGLRLDEQALRVAARVRQVGGGEARLAGLHLVDARQRGGLLALLVLEVRRAHRGLVHDALDLLLAPVAVVLRERDRQRGSDRERGSRARGRQRPARTEHPAGAARRGAAQRGAAGGRRTMPALALVNTLL